MSLLDKVWDFLQLPADEAFAQMYKSRRPDWVAEFVPDDQVPSGFAPKKDLVSDQTYFTITAQKSALPYTRILWKSYFGVVHSTVLTRKGNSTPQSTTVFRGLGEELLAIDKDARQHAILGPTTLVDTSPFRGASARATIALMAVEARDFAQPFLATLEGLSTVAGCSFLGAAKKLAEPLVAGVQQLVSIDKGCSTQVAYAGNLANRTGVFLIAATPKSDFDWTNYTLGDDFGLRRGGMPVEDFAYIVLTVEAVASRENWLDIPEINSAHTAIWDAIRSAGLSIADKTSPGYTKVLEAFAVFDAACVTSQDLCSDDAVNIVGQCRDKLKAYIARNSGGLTSARAVPNANAAFTPEPFSFKGIQSRVIR